MKMVELLLNVIYATRAGNWNLHLESIHEILPYTFAYDHLRYAKYLTPMFGEMLNLEINHPEIYREFSLGNFAFQLSRSNPFGSVEADNIIETIINKDTKCPGSL